MRHLDYKNWAEYLADLISIYPIEINRVLEVGAGRGNISKFLNKQFENYFISDISFEMISKSSLRENRCVCDMSVLPFKGKFDVIFSIFDSVNYLVNPKNFVHFLQECESSLADNGILLFDVSLEKNSLANIRALNRKGVYKGIRFKQISSYDNLSRFHTNVIEMIIDGDHIIETHKQRIYKYKDYFGFAEEANLKVLDTFDCFTFDDSTSNSERVQFVLGKL